MPKPPDENAWLAYGIDDLASAECLVKNEIFARNAAYLAQQAAEKILKAVMVKHRLAVPRIHDLGVLADTVAKWIDEIGNLREDLEWLAMFAVQVRYPSHSGLAITREHAERAIGIAEQIKEICLHHLKNE